MTRGTGRKVATPSPGGEVTPGQRESATNRLFETLYAELRQIAARFMRRENAKHTLQPTALVHEVYLRLAGSPGFEEENRERLLGIAAGCMRRVLVDHARRRAAARRGGNWKRVTLEDSLARPGVSEVDVLELDRALTRLAEHDLRMSRVVEMRVFGGMTMGEIGRMLGVAERTVHNDWRVAKMWLTRELTES